MFGSQWRWRSVCQPSLPLPLESSCQTKGLVWKDLAILKSLMPLPQTPQKTPEPRGMAYCHPHKCIANNLPLCLVFGADQEAPSPPKFGAAFRKSS